jgi:hypothetical protein
MARVHLHLRVQGNVSNDFARQFQAGVKAFNAGCADAGLEVRGDGLTVDLDDEAVEPPVAEPPAGEDIA